MEKLFSKISRGGRRLLVLTGLFAACGLFALFAGPVFRVFGDTGKAAQSLFVLSNQQYRQGEYLKAEQGYEKLIKDGFNGPALFYNLGNCNLRMGKVGVAVLNFERAKVEKPRDADIAYNLALTMEKVTDQPDRPQSELFGWLSSVSASEAGTAFAILNALFFLILAIRVWKKDEAFYYLAAALFTLWLTAGFLAGAKYSSLASDHRAVVVSRQVSVRAGPSEKETLLFNLHAGSVVSQGRTEGGYSLVSFSDKKRGWVLARDIRSILPLPPAQPL